jgi:hypothetical protein
LEALLVMASCSCTIAAHRQCTLSRHRHTVLHVSPAIMPAGYSIKQAAPKEKRPNKSACKFAMASWRIRELVKQLERVYPRVAARDPSGPSRASLPDPRRPVSDQVPVTRADQIQAFTQAQPRIRTGAVADPEPANAENERKTGQREPQAQPGHGNAPLSQDHQHLHPQLEPRFARQDAQPPVSSQMMPMRLTPASYGSPGGPGESGSGHMGAGENSWGYGSHSFSPPMHSYQQAPPAYQGRSGGLGLSPTDQGQYGSQMLPHMGYGGYGHSP